MKIRGCTECSNCNITRFNLCESCRPINNIVSPKSTIYFDLNDNKKDIKKLDDKKEIEMSDLRCGKNSICEIKVGSIGRGLVFDLDGNRFNIRSDGYSNKTSKLYNIIRDSLDCNVVDKSGGCYVRILGDSQINIDKIIENSDKYTEAESLYDPNKNVRKRYIRNKNSNIVYIKQPNLDSDIINIFGFNSKQYVKQLVKKTYEELVYYSI